MNPFDNSQTTPTMTQTINALIDKKLCEVHTSLPAEIISYDYGENLAVVQPSLKRKYKTENSAISLPTISDVPVSFPRMGSGHLRIPVNPGDTGQIIFNERSIDGWLQSGGEIDPQDPRKHSLSDAVFYPGLNPKSNPMESSAAEDSLELKLNDSYIEILGNGKFKITDGTEELFDLIVQLQEQVIEMNNQLNIATTNTIFGPLQLNNFAQFLLLKQQVEIIKTKTETLKGD